MLKNPQQKRHFMKKLDYAHLLETRPWKEMEDHFNDLPIHAIKSFNKIKINTQDWVDFTVNHFDLAVQKWEEPKPHYSNLGNKWSEINANLGRDKYNSFELSFGMLGDSNEQLKDILGLDNIRALGINPNTVLLKFIVKFPGHGAAWHADYLDSYVTKFPSFDENKVRRYWFSIDDWQDGHVFQVSKTVLSHWSKGEVFNIPRYIGHATSNFGYRPMYTVSFTGVLD